MFNAIKSFFVLPLILLVLTGSAQSEAGEDFSHLPDNEQKADTLLALAKAKWYTDPDASIAYAKLAHKVSLSLKNRHIQADALNVTGAGFYFKEQSDSAIIYYEKSLALCQELDYSEGIARVTNNLGLIYDLQGDYDEAMDFYYQSLEIEKGQNNQQGIAAAYLNIGNIYYYLGEYGKALELMSNSLGIYQKVKDEAGILRCFTNIGTTYSEMGIYENALTYCEKALDLSRTIQDPDLEAANLNNIGKIYFSSGKLSKALDFYNQALDLAIDYEDPWSEANTLRNIGGVYVEQNNMDRALEYFNKALQIAEALEARNLVMEIYSDLAGLYESKNEFKKALYFNKEHAYLKDSLFGENSRTEIARVESAYKLKLKDQQLEIMRHENAVKNLTIKNQRNTLITVALIGLLLLSIATLFYYRLRINRRAREILENSNKVISEQKKLLEESIHELKTREQRYHALASSIQDGLIILQDKKLIYVNEPMYQMLGYKNRETLLSRKPDKIIAPADFEKVAQNYTDRIAGKKVPESYPIKLLDEKGNAIEVTIQVTLTSLYGNPAIIGTIKDDSESRSFEKRLVEEKQKAEKATISKSMFLAGMSHEIRNQMNSLMGITDVLSDTNLTEEQQKYLEVIKNSGDKLLNIINDILDISKIEAGQIVLDPVPFSLKNVLQDIIALHDLDARQKGLYLRGDVSSEVPEKLEGDTNRLSQVLTNLVGNAIKFTDKGGVEIHITQLKHTKRQVRLKISVIDTGIGISKNSLDKLFKPFSQTHAAVERKTEGSGLGLAICKNLVHLMGGEIGVDTTEGSGSTFWFTVNFAKPGNIKPDVQSINKSKNKNRILLVEDNLLNQHLTTNILSREGYSADIASNGQEGVNLFKKKFYPVILMDIQMPVMDGIEATREIRDYESSHYSDKSKIIAVSAHTKDSEQQQLLDAGLDFFIQKPFKPEQLLKLIRDQ